MNFNAFINDINTNHWNIFGVEVYENGQLAHSYGDTCGELHEVYSATKSILSVAVGMAWDRGLFELDKCVLDYLPVERVERMSGRQREDFSCITIERLLTMSVDGFPFRPAGESYLDFSLNCEICEPLERRFNYSNICAYLVGAALTHAIGEDLGVFIEKNLFQPLGIERYEYGRCPEGCFYGASQVKLTVHDLSKIGLMLSNKGIYNGKRIISESYVQRATSVQQMNREGGYGYFIWKYKNGFSINGKWGQKCYCLPKQGLMITYLAHVEHNSHDITRSMEKHIPEINDII